jgi:hypothetical protein
VHYIARSDAQIVGQPHCLSQIRARMRRDSVTRPDVIDERVVPTDGLVERKQLSETVLAAPPTPTVVALCNAR